ncbi:MAG: hypothetical protein K9H25_02585 [Rhodospirillum sp.]|nr:hypothetical protein [Rhodospirillum sp.]MCF8488542.1 hypothetical protein [Rhodospirillum sp.]MCF8499138.1 hypothetical protein [Rhodospirillum sp.]
MDSSTHVDEAVLNTHESPSSALDTLLGETRDLALNMAEREKDALSQAIARRAQALKAASAPFRDTDPALADGLLEIAEEVARRAAHLEARPLPDLMDDAGGWIRDNPILALGAAALVGVAAGRLLRAGTGPDT